MVDMIFHFGWDKVELKRGYKKGLYFPCFY